MVSLAPLLILATALLLGLGHSLDADHVVAVSAILCKCTNLRKSLVSATAWGTGHSITLLFAGLLILVLSVSIPEKILNLFDAGAGAMLIVLGALIWRPIIIQSIRASQHKNETVTGNHVHIEASSDSHSLNHVHKSIFTGALQGLGGTAALMLVTLAAVNSIELGVVFITIFCLGVIAGMILISLGISSVLKYTASHLERVHEKIMMLTGSISIGFGLFLILQVVLGLHIYS